MAGGSVGRCVCYRDVYGLYRIGVGRQHIGCELLQIPVSILSGLVLGVLLGWLLTRYFKRYHMRDSVKVLIILSVSFLLVALERVLKGILPVSGLLAVMALGATLLKNYEVLALRLSAKFSKLWVGAEILLFVLVGSTVDIKYAVGAGLSAVVVILFSLLFRMAGVFVCMIKNTANAQGTRILHDCLPAQSKRTGGVGSLPLAMGLPCGKIVFTVAVLAIR